MSFTKLDSGIVNSSIWSEPLETRVLWITMLAMSDENGFVACSEPGLVRAANIQKNEFEKAIKVLEGPDKFSRTSDNEGRRVEKIDEGWIILNFKKYRLHSEKKRAATRERVTRYRALQALHGVTPALPSASASVSSSESVLGDKSREKRGEPEPASWRTDFKIYQAECEKAFQAALDDKEWFKERQTYHPTLDLDLTIDKAYTDFWNTEAGWQHKRKTTKKGSAINWRNTINNSLSLPSNQVKKPYEAKAFRK